MPTSFVVRHLDPVVDLSRLVALHAAIAEADHDEPASEDELRVQLAWPGHDPVQDRWVIEEPGNPERLVASGFVWRSSGSERADASIAVHPAWRRRGLGRDLLARLTERTRQLGATYLAGYAAERDDAANAFAVAQGLEPMPGYIRMEAPDGTPTPDAVWPTGYRVRSFAEIQSLSALAAAMTRSFDGIWGHRPVTADDLAQWLPDLQPEGIFLAYGPDGESAGLCLTEARNAEGSGPIRYIDGPGVVTEHRSADLHRPLLLAGMRWLREHGGGSYVLESWGDADATLALYGDLGFAVTRRSIAYRMRVSSQ